MFPDISSNTETLSAFANGSISVISGRPFAVSHFDTVLLLTPSISACYVWERPFFSRKIFIVIPVTVVFIDFTLLMDPL